jgi:hypothetical protein
MDVLSTLPRRRFPIRALGFLASGALGLVLLLLNARALAVAAPAELQASENRVKAAFVYKFGDYIEWPPEAFDTSDSPLVIGVVGADATADELSRIAAGHTIGGRKVAVKKLRYGDSLSGLHVVFIGRSDTRRVTAAIEASKGRPALTITETIDGLKLGSVINFVVVANKVRFDVALPSAEASRLKISSRLLAVARTVVESVP